MEEIKANENGKSQDEIYRDMFEKAKSGTLKLKAPIMNEGIEITELEYDFTRITGNDYVDAMDSDKNAINVFVTTNRQDLMLFAIAAEKCCREKYKIDRQDIMSRIGIADARAAAQTAQVFLNLCNRVL